VALSEVPVGGPNLVTNRAGCRLVVGDGQKAFRHVFLFG